MKRKSCPSNKCCLKRRVAPCKGAHIPWVSVILVGVTSDQRFKRVPCSNPTLTRTNLGQAYVQYKNKQHVITDHDRWDQQLKVAQCIFQPTMYHYIKRIKSTNNLFGLLGCTPLLCYIRSKESTCHDPMTQHARQKTRQQLHQILFDR